MESAAVQTLPEVHSHAAPTAPAASQQSPFLSVVIVNYRQWCNTARLVRQLLNSQAGRSGAGEVVVVDNHSPRHPWRRRLRRMNGVSLRCWGRNRGFAGGVNEGCRLSRGEWFLLLNPDVTVQPGFLDAALAYAERIQAQDPAAGIIGFQVRDPSGAVQPSAGQFPCFAKTLLGVLRKRSARKCRAVHGHARKPVAWLTGCCLLIRRDCFRQLGGFDRDFFLYYEDVNLCRRASQAGWSIWYEPSMHITHHHPLHGRDVPACLRMVTRHALLTYARKHWRHWQFQALTGIVILEATLRQCRERMRQRPDTARVFGEMKRLAIDMLFGRFARSRKRLMRIVGKDGGGIRRSEAGTIISKTTDPGTEMAKTRDHAAPSHVKSAKV